MDEMSAKSSKQQKEVKPRARYIPQKTGPTQRDQRLAAIKAQAEEERVEQATSAAFLKPVREILLEGELADIYLKIYGKRKGVIIWQEFMTLFTRALGGRIDADAGNGSVRTLTLPVINQVGLSILSSRPIHEPHPFDELRNHMLSRIKMYFEMWGIGIDQGHIKL
jgi:hypothetical protein